MESQNGNVNPDESALLQCITELKKDNRSDLETIQSTMLEKHNMDHKQTEALIETLKNNTRVFTMQQKGVTMYMTVQSPYHMKKSRNTETKEMGLLVTKCVKAINQVSSVIDMPTYIYTVMVFGIIVFLYNSL